MRKPSILIITLLIAMLVFTVSCSCGDEDTSAPTTTTPETEAPTQAIGEGVVLSSLPQSALPEMPQVPDAPEESIGQAAEDESSIPAILKFEEGTVNVQRDSKSIESQDGMEIYPGDYIVIEGETKATIYFFDGSISVIEGPCGIEFLISEQTNDDTAIELQLDSGNIITKVGNLLTSKSSHRVRTANTIAGAWGTIYEIIVTPEGITRCTVSSGKIRTAYVGLDAKGKSGVFTAILEAKTRNTIDIPPVSGERLAELAESLNLTDKDTKTILDHLDERLDTEAITRTTKPTTAPRPTSSTPTHTDDDSTDVTNEGIIDKIIAATRKVQSCKFDVDMKMRMSGTSDGESLDMDATMIQIGAMDKANQKMRIDMDTNVDMSSIGAIEASIEIYIIGDTTYMKTGEMFGTPAQWTKAETPGMWDTQDIIARQTDLLDVTSLQVSDGGIVNGVNCYRVEMEPDLMTLLKSVMQQPGMGESLSAGGLPDDMDISLLSNLVQDFSATQWYSKDTHFPVKSEIEVQMAVSELMMSMMGESGEMAIDINMTTNFSDYNKPVSIELPAEARGAIDTMDMY